MKKLFTVLLCLGLAGCATAPSFDKISIGMPKQDVITQLGSPQSISAKDNVEYLKYLGHNPAWSRFNDAPKTIAYFVRLINGKVESYGQEGDFNSAPANNINLNVNSGNK